MAEYQERLSQDEDAPPKVVRRRRRPPLSCTECRRRKLKCDRSLPCGQCVRSKTADSCVFNGPQPGSASESSRHMSPPVSHLPGGSDNQSATGGMFVFDSKIGPKSNSNRITKRSQSGELHELRQRLRMLENALARPNTLATPNALQTPEASVSQASQYDTVSEFGTSYHSAETAGVDDRVRFLPDSSFRGKKGKTRYFGRSHYTTTVSFFQDIGSFLRRGHTDIKDKEYTDMKSFKCELWSRESQDHQRAFREQAFKFSLVEMVPERNMADQLLQLYLNTFETTYRILHIPTFLQRYEAYWADPDPSKPDIGFVAQLLAVMAAGSCFHISPHKEQRTYQKPVMKWVMAVQSYISCTFVSPEIDLRMIQTQTLLLVARQAVAYDGDVAWASAGSLIRSAMTMGLHRDPTRFRKTVSPFWCELRRRLWATIVELDLNLSLDRGVPPSIDLDECDCDAPSNWDDDDLVENMETNPAPLSIGNFYQTLLTRTLILRHRITKRINTLKFDLSYDDALRMGEELLRSVKNASSSFEDNASSIGDISRHRFAQSLHLFIIRKFLLALHRPFSLSVVRLPKCSYSRKICLEESLEILSQMELPSSPDIQYPHITQLGSGMFRDEIFHASITVCVELSLQAQEMGYSHGGYSRGATMEGMNSSVLMSMVHSQQSVMLQAVERALHDFGRRISAAGNGSKPYCFLSIILASVKSRIKGEDPLSQVEAASKKAVRVCRAKLTGLSYGDALASVENSFLQQSQAVQDGTTPMSGSSTDFDLPSLLSTDFGDFTTADLGSWFDGLDAGAMRLCDTDLFSSLPSLP